VSPQTLRASFRYRYPVAANASVFPRIRIIGVFLNPAKINASDITRDEAYAALEDGTIPASGVTFTRLDENDNNSTSNNIGFSTGAEFLVSNGIYKVSPVIDQHYMVDLQGAPYIVVQIQTLAAHASGNGINDNVIEAAFYT